jgi:hypothetical protein
MLNFGMQRDIMPSLIMPSVNMLNVVIQTAIMLNILAPKIQL